MLTATFPLPAVPYGIALALTCSLTVALKAQNIYVSNLGDNTIGEYGLDGSTVNASLISGLDEPLSIVISPAPVPEPSTLALAGTGSIIAWLFLWRRKPKFQPC